MNTEIDLAALEKNLIDWVRDWTEEGAGTEIGPDTELGGTGLLDSMGMVALITYLEDETGHSFDFGTFDAAAGTDVRSLIRHCLA